MSEMADYLDIVFKCTEIGSLIAGGMLLVRKIGQDSAELKSKIDSQAAKVDATLSQQNSVVGELKDDIKALNKLITAVAVQNVRMDQITERMNRQDKMIDELRHGTGFIKGDRGIDHEYGK